MVRTLKNLHTKFQETCFVKCGLSVKLLSQRCIVLVKCSSKRVLSSHIKDAGTAIRYSRGHFSILQALEMDSGGWTLWLRMQNRRKSMNSESKSKEIIVLDRKSQTSGFAFFRCSEKSRISAGSCLQQQSLSTLKQPLPKPTIQTLKLFNYAGFGLVTVIGAIL